MSSLSSFSDEPAAERMARFARTLSARVAGRFRPGAAASQHDTARRFAGFTFLLRVGNAGIAFLTQILLARWIGAGEFGVYAYVWTWVLLLGAVSSLGLATSTQRFIPEYLERGRLDLLRGFLAGSRLLALTAATAAMAVGFLVLALVGDGLGPGLMLPAALGLLCLPAYVLTDVQECIARSYDWSSLAMWPAYVIRPLLFVAGAIALAASGLAGGAVGAMTAALAATWVTAAVQTVRLHPRLRHAVPRGPAAFVPRTWLAVSLPTFLVDGFFLLLSYTDVIVLERFVTPEDVGVYYAATKLVSPVAFVFFAVAAASAHRFTRLHVAGRPEELAAFMRASIRWTFLPSLGLSAMLLAFGGPLLHLFGPDFGRGWPALAVLLVGLIARASIGPCEKLLNMLGHQGVCAAVYAVSFALNLGVAVVLVPQVGLVGAAIATSLALVVESVLLARAAHRRLGIRVFVWRRRGSGTGEPA